MNAPAQKTPQEVIARTIVDQLGGNKFCTMVGVKGICYGDFGAVGDSNTKYPGVTIQFKASRKYSHVVVTLTPMDTYEMTFYKSFTMKETYVNVYCDDLERIFQETTGLDTRLF